ncbi:LOW QUALITY PROTEIN: DNA polymerase kappa [Fundulus heteroclitus]|uniref:LOW QUALITY PROTEIN: DNA polymerase kappa n=1 Tax=Fundulus heteroclitus TaxID=8078 RepID=UPI00165A71B2|nr:LOW QUALITY PROTEIN: DNA polymerase kappa [Fundulus heteroclitus]
MENGVGSTKEENLLSRMALNDNKAGMEGLDRDKINRIIMEASKGSRFYENELKKEQQVNQRIEKMMQQKARLTEQQLQRAQAQVEKMASELERSRDLSRAIVHVDMDAFYAAVEMRDCPELKDKPMAVGSMSMLSTSNYHARKYGVRAAMPGFIAKRLCPGLVIVPLNFDKYRAVSEEVREIFAEYGPNFQPMSLDEAYLDFTDHLEQRQSWPESLRTHRYRSRSNTPAETAEGADLSPVLFDSLSSSGGDAGGPSELFGTSVEEAVREMRFRIEQKTTLTASAGIAPNMMLAKVCSDKNKPNGQYRLPPTREAVMDFTQKLPVRKVCGIGKVSEKMLNTLGITTCSDLSQRMALLSLLFSETSWHHFLQISLGLSSTHIPRHEERKSMSTERTFKELSKPEEQFSLCRELCEDLADDLKKEALKGKTVTLKLKNVNFEVKTKAQTLPYAVAQVEDIFAVAKDLLKMEIESESPQPLRLRLMGVRISAFVSSDDKTPMQKSIISFLQPGKAGCGRSPQILHETPEGGDVRGHSIQSSQLTHDAPVQNGQTQNKVCWRSKPGHSGEEQPPQQSFFQRAHAKRLQLQAERTSPVITAESSQPADTNDPTVQDLPEDEPASPVERRASSPGCRALAESLTCPVCFRNVDTADLDAFNRHIDSCLSEAAGREDHVSDAECRPDPEPDHPQSAAVPEQGRWRAVEKEPSCGGSPPEGQGTWRSDPASLIQADRQPAARQRRSPHGKSPVLTCPVCQRTQDTDDLAVFNRHVDLCLNQEVLHELGGQAAFSGEAPAVKHSCDTDAGRLLPRQASKGKSKRRDTPSSPPSKKAKSLGLSNTIDKFFR